MTEVFVLQHVHAMESNSEDVKMIGVYSTEASATQAIARLSSQPGFKDSPDDFHISRYVIDEDHWTEGYISWTEALGDNPAPVQKP